MSQTKPKQQNQPSEPQRHAGSAQHEAQKPIAPEQHAPLPQHKLKNIGANVVDTGVVGQKAFVGGATSEGEPKAKPAHTESKPKGDQRQQKATPTSEHAESEEPKDSQPPRQTPPSGAKGKGSGQPQQQQQQPPSAAPKGAAQQPMEQATKASPKMTAAPAKSAAAGTKKETSPKPPTQHLHKKGHGKEHAFGGHSIPRADSDDCDPRDLYPKPPYDEQTQAAPAIEGKMKYLPDFGEYSYNGSGKLKDKVCLVTGGDSGIGRAVSVAFAREGADSVMIQYLPVEQADAQETERVVTTANCGFFGFACDLATEDACKQMVDAAVAKFGRIDVLVCNAAMQGKTVKSISEITGERVSKTFAVNVLSIFHTIRFALPHMKPGSCIITTSSIQATDPSCFIADYAATKAAVSNITSSMCRELLTKGIRINSVAPGPVWTPLIAQSFPKENLSKFGSGDLGQGVYGRPAQPCEMAPAFVFLACNTDSSYVNGSVIHVDGGSNS